MIENIGPFKLYKKKPNAIRHGFLYELEMELPVPFEQKRMVRVFVPEDYDTNKKYPVLYCVDGQNCVDKYLTAYGEWDMDVRQYQLRKEGYSPFIIVGIDCPKNPLYRELEYSIDLPYTKLVHKLTYKNFEYIHPYSHKLTKFIAETLKPLIDKNFSTSRERELTGCGGSSMGGLFSMTLFSEYPEVFGYCLSFSPAYGFYLIKDLYPYLDKKLEKADRNSKIFIYTGTKGFEYNFYPCSKRMFKYLNSKGFKCDLIIDDKGIHNEKTWSKYFVPAMRFWLPKE